jgi:hypothetical protein
VGGPEFLIGPEGYVLDPESVRWTRLPEPLPGLRDSRSAVWAGSGEQLVAFGGVVSSRQELAFTAQTWIWQATAG